MNFTAEIDIMPKKELLDPQGKTVTKNMKNIDVHGVSDIRIGKHVSMSFDAANESEAKEKVEMACKKLLANMIMESYSYTLSAN